MCLLCALSAVTAAAAAPAPPSPTFAESVVVAPVSGKVLVRTPGAAYATPLTAVRLVPVGTVVDTTGGRVGAELAVVMTNTVPDDEVGVGGVGVGRGRVGD